MADDRRLAVDELARLPDRPAEELHERLVAQAHSESRDPAAQALQNGDRRACVLRPAGPR